METLAFVKERNEALRSLDKEKILAYVKKYNLNVPRDERVFWAAIHKARLEVNAMTDDEKGYSREWLRRNGFRAGIF